MGWVHPSGLGGQNAAVGIEDTGSPPHPRRLVMHLELFDSTNPVRRPTKHIALRSCLRDAFGAHCTWRLDENFGPGAPTQEGVLGANLTATSGE